MLIRYCFTIFVLLFYVMGLLHEVNERSLNLSYSFCLLLVALKIEMASSTFRQVR